jgi:hypothetical protein
LPLGVSNSVNITRAGVLLAVKETSIEYTVIISDLSALAVNYFVKLLVLMLAIADVRHRTAIL